MQKNLPNKFADLNIGGEVGGGGGGQAAAAAEGEDDDQTDEDGKKRQKRGGKGIMKAKKKEAELEKRITLSIAPRGKKKAVTVVQGKIDPGIKNLKASLKKDFTF